MRITIRNTITGIDERMTPREAAREIIGRTFEWTCRQLAAVANWWIGDDAEDCTKGRRWMK